MKKNKHSYGILMKGISLLFFAFFTLKMETIFAQIVSNNGAFISFAIGTVIGADTINNDNTTTLANAGTLNTYSINNSGIIQGDGTYNIARNFINTGTFSCGSSSVNYNGSVAQNIAALNYYDLIVTLNGTRAITLAGTIGVANIFSPATTTTSTFQIATIEVVDK